MKTKYGGYEFHIHGNVRKEEDGVWAFTVWESTHLDDHLERKAVLRYGSRMTQPEAFAQAAELVSAYREVYSA